jgi:Fe-S-cluster containining protein
MTFYCLRCGECCSAMGDVHKLEHEPGGDLAVRNRYTGEATRVVLDPDKAGLLDGPPIPGACLLFRRDAGGRGVCTVHETWPAVCAEYVCWRILVLSSSGERAARVMGSRHIAVDDPAFETVLAPHANRLAGAIDEPAWDALLIFIIKASGYEVVR